MRYLIPFLLLTSTLAGPVIVGEWTTGSVSSIQYRDRVTGESAPPSGNTMTYKFRPDGTYDQSGLLQFSMSNCTSAYYMQITGRYGIDGDTLTLTPTDGTFESKGGCGAKPMTRPANKVQTVVQIRLSGPEMVMTDREGKQSTFRRR